MVDYTDDDLKRATGIVESLSPDGEGPQKLRKDLEDGLSIFDLQTHAEQFYDDLNFIEILELDYPALRLGDKSQVPLALSEITGPSAPMFGFAKRRWLEWIPLRLFRDEVSRELRRTMRRFGNAATTLSPPEARSTFVSRASKFLASRIAGRRMLAGGPPGEPPEPPPALRMAKFIGGPPTNVSGCLFSVHTNSPGLSAYWSGAYLILSNYHGAPTTPAKGVLQAGTYVFGVNGGGYGSGVQWDLNKVCTLPGTSSVRLQF